MIDLVVLDVGNTAVKVGLFAGAELVARAWFGHRSPDSLALARDFVARASATALVAAAAVRPERVKDLLDACAAGRRCLVAPTDFAPTVRNDAEPPASVGLDRLFNAAAVADTAGPTVVVDAGTAVTVDRVEPPGVFRGGAIAPGLRLGFEGLHHGTSQLPLVPAPEVGAGVPALGRDTVAAIRAGVVRGVAGGIERLARDLGVGDDALLVLTGGDALRLLPFLSLELRHEPDLTLLGIARGARAAPGRS